MSLTVLWVVFGFLEVKLAGLSDQLVNEGPAGPGLALPPERPHNPLCRIYDVKKVLMVWI